MLKKLDNALVESIRNLLDNLPNDDKQEVYAQLGVAPVDTARPATAEQLIPNPPVISHYIVVNDYNMRLCDDDTMMYDDINTAALVRNDCVLEYGNPGIHVRGVVELDETMLAEVYAKNAENVVDQIVEFSEVVSA